MYTLEIGSNSSRSTLTKRRSKQTNMPLCLFCMGQCLPIQEPDDILWEDYRLPTVAILCCACITQCHLGGFYLYLALCFLVNFAEI